MKRNKRCDQSDQDIERATSQADSRAVRSGSVKRVAAAVSEGAQVVATLHAFLANDRA